MCMSRVSVCARACVCVYVLPGLNKHDGCPVAGPHIHIVFRRVHNYHAFICVRHSYARTTQRHTHRRKKTHTRKTQTATTKNRRTRRGKQVDTQPNKSTHEHEI